MTARSAVQFIVFSLMLALAWAAHAASTETSPQFDVADRYFATYLTGNIAALSPWMDGEIHFFDTASDFKGREATLIGLADVFKSIRMGTFTETHRQRDGLLSTYRGTLAFSMDGAALGAPGKWYSFEVPFSVILRMNGDKVIEHQDLVDTDALNAQFRAQFIEATASGQNASGQTTSEQK